MPQSKRLIVVQNAMQTVKDTVRMVDDRFGPCRFHAGPNSCLCDALDLEVGTWVPH